MKRIIVLTITVLLISGAACSTISSFFTDMQPLAMSSSDASLRTRVLLPGRSPASSPSAMPPHMPNMTLPAAVITSPFNFPTISSGSLTPRYDCTTIFPLANVEAIEFGTTTFQQLESVFGRGTAGSGRTTRFKFEAESCVLWITVADNTAQEVELVNYGALDLLLEHYGEPATVGISEGNLTLLDVGSAVMFYPEEGVIAIFAMEPAALTRSTPITQLFFRPSYQVEKQLARLNVLPTEWQSPQH